MFLQNAVQTNQSLYRCLQLIRIFVNRIQNLDIITVTLFLSYLSFSNPCNSLDVFTGFSSLTSPLPDDLVYQGFFFNSFFRVFLDLVYDCLKSFLFLLRSVIHSITFVCVYGVHPLKYFLCVLVFLAVCILFWSGVQNHTALYKAR